MRGTPIVRWVHAQVLRATCECGCAEPDHIDVEQILSATRRLPRRKIGHVALATLARQSRKS
jgi:hypothetical protein